MRRFVGVLALLVGVATAVSGIAPRWVTGVILPQPRRYHYYYSTGSNPLASIDLAGAVAVLIVGILLLHPSRAEPRSVSGEPDQSRRMSFRRLAGFVVSVLGLAAVVYCAIQLAIPAATPAEAGTVLMTSGSYRFVGPAGTAERNELIVAGAVVGLLGFLLTRRPRA